MITNLYIVWNGGRRSTYQYGKHIGFVACFVEIVKIYCIIYSLIYGMLGILILKHLKFKKEDLIRPEVILLRLQKMLRQLLNIM